MKFSVASSELLKVLTKASGVVPSKSTLPILENYLFDLSKDTLKITATDLEVSLSTSLHVTGEENGKMAIPARRMMETVRALPNVDMKFIGDIANKKLNMKTKNGEYKLAGESSEDYPTIPLPKGDEQLVLEKEILTRLINQTSFAVSTDELRPAMMGVLFQIKKDEIRAVATDGHRLVKFANAAVRSAKIERDVIIPAKALHILTKSLEEESSTISIDNSHIVFTFGDTVLISRLIGEKYPSYESVIPSDNDKQLVVNKNEILASVRRIALYASSTTHQVRFTLKKNTLIISAEDIDFGNEATETLTCDYSSDPMEIGFNASYIIDILSHIDTDDVIFMLSSPTRAGLVRPAKQREGEDLLMLVMPVRLNA